jgi:hypothetical protein
MERAVRWRSWALMAGLAVALSGAVASAGEATELEVGSEAPRFKLEASNGSSHDLADLRGEKSLILVFWRGTW